MVSVTTPLCHCGMKAATDNMQTMGEAGLHIALWAVVADRYSASVEFHGQKQIQISKPIRSEKSKLQMASYLTIQCMQNKTIYTNKILVIHT